MANAVRFRTRSYDGKEVIRHHDGEKERWVYVHRLAMYAWSPELELEDLWTAPPGERTADPRTQKLEVHHDIPIGWLNAEWNLEWLDGNGHGRVESARRRRGPDGRYAPP